MDKKTLSEVDICDLFITPAIKDAGWDPTSQIRREVTLAPGPVVVRGNVASRNKKKKKFADYVLYKELGVPLAVVEAKDNNHTVSHGLQQALGYAEILNVPSAFSSNGDAFASHNKVPSSGEDIETQFPLQTFPGPNALWSRYKTHRRIKDQEEPLVLVPFHEDASGKEPRYYQADAINHAIEAIASGQKRVLLVMATGTGKTYTTFQIIWRLWKAGKVKRALFLADRNILIDQALINDFKPFAGAMVKVTGHKFDPAFEVHLALYQAITGSAEEDKSFKKLSHEFFDLIVIDECHRGSVAEDAQWREILDYFSGAIQIGMTATPKETKYVSNTTYFGEPVYTYSLKQGIEDGFLAPYKVIRIDIDKDIDGWTPPPGMVDDLGRQVPQREYNQADMDRILVLNQRTRLVARRVMQYLKATDPYAKTIIFCEDIDHAERMRAAIVNEAGPLAIEHPKYVMRITGDSNEGKAELDNFIDPQSRFPVIATTSELMTTGVDARTCKLIVLDKTVNSMTTFKQIIGRGTRILEEYNKFFFTIMDFKKATTLFNDPDFDGEPVVIYEPGDDDDPVPPDPDSGQGEEGENADGDAGGEQKVYVSGVPVRIIGERVEYVGTDGKLVTESYREFARKQVRNEFSSLNDFIRRWNSADRKQAIVDELEQYGVSLKTLEADVGKDLDPFDLILHVGYDQRPLTRKERAEEIRKRNYFAKYGQTARAVLEALLDKYQDEGVVDLNDPNVLRIAPLSSMGTPVQLVKRFGSPADFEAAVRDLQNTLYRDAS
ncbi:EcoAI/FtnUII family type I restriction enzme subunit R [Bradyrhizobium ottawaense]|uniref:EcoAI/FtnUII family type I restriction enzme subunit R n=1 Tax=Bradyrhizobium ottawaense TaxID=931866 RepID=UPI001BAAF993|nr:DEAD/DEAH box helicase family protein [Bradyrhizobium ottawaense]